MLTGSSVSKNKVTGVNNDRTRNFDSDDANYLSQIEQYKDKSWYQYLLNNPYMGSKNSEFSPSFFQTIAEGFGDTSSRDRYYSDLAFSRQEWLDKKLEQFREQDYNEPIEQVKREQAAGLNPSLAPESISPGQAAEDDTNTMHESPAAKAAKTAEDISNAGLNFIGSIFQFGSMLQGLFVNEAGLVAQDLANNETAMNYAINTISGLSGMEAVSDDFSDLSPEERANLIAPARKTSDRLHLRGFNRKTRKLVSSWYDAFESGEPMALEAVRSQLKKTIVQNKVDTAKETSMPYYDKDFQKMEQKLANGLSKAEYAAELAGRYASTSQSGYEQAYYHGEKLKATIQNMREEAYNEVRSAVETGKGKWWYFPAKMALPRLRSTIDDFFNVAPSVAGAVVTKKAPGAVSHSVVHSYSHKM